MADPNPACYWRQVLRSGVSAYRPLAGADHDEHFRQFVEKAYSDEKERLGRKLNCDPDPDTASISLYILSLILLTYGRIDVVTDILENLPSSTVPARTLARCVQQLLPMEGLDVLADTPAALDWYRAHRDRLRWDEPAGLFRSLDG